MNDNSVIWQDHIYIYLLDLNEFVLMTLGQKSLYMYIIAVWHIFFFI